MAESNSSTPTLGCTASPLCLIGRATAPSEEAAHCLPDLSQYPGEDWPTDEFIATEVHLASGQQITITLAERGAKLSNGLWVREFRKLCESGHQTAFLSADYRAPAAVLAPAMFGRWSQENFFRYMRQSFNLDGVVDYRSDTVPDTIMVVNPAHHVLDGEVRKKVGLLNCKIAEFGAINLDGRD